MKTFTRLFAIALASFATLTACGGGGGGYTPPTTPTTPTTPLSNGDVVIDLLAFGAPPSPSVETSFESIEVTNGGIGPFSVGTMPFRATFSTGRAESRGVDALYRDGVNSWHILYGTLAATVTFDAPPSTLSFWVRTENAADVSTIEIFDLNSALIPPVITPTNIFQQIFVTRTPAETLIGSMVVTNPL